MRLLTIALIAVTLSACFDIEANLPKWCYYPEHVEANWDAYTSEERKNERICEPLIVTS